MATLRRFGWLDLILLLVVVVAGAGTRAAYLVSAAEGGRSAGPLRVQDARDPNELRALIDNIAQHGWFGCAAPFSEGQEATAHVSPGYPYLVGTLARMVDADNLDLVVRWGQVVLGALTCGLYFLFARRAFQNLLVATLAGLLTAAHPFWVVATAHVDDAVVASFLLGLVLYTGARAGQDGGPLSGLLFGLGLACLALVRAAALPFGFAALVWFLLRAGSARWVAALVAFGSFLAPLGWCVAMHYQRFEEPVPLVDSVPLHLWVGNNPHATGGPLTDKARDSAPRNELKAITHQPSRYARLGELAAEEVRADPAEALRRRLHAGLCFFFGEGWLRQGRLAEVDASAEESSLVESAPLLLHVALVVMLLSLLGWRWSYGWRWESMPAALAVIWLPLPYVLGHAEWLSGPRLPLDGVLLSLAAFTLVALVPGLGDPLRQGMKAKAEDEEG